MNHTIALLTLAFGLIGSASSYAGDIRVITSTSDLAYFARVVGGDYVDVEALAAPRADVHYIEVRPSHMVKVRRARVALKVGLELDRWMDAIIDGSRNSGLNVVDCSRYIEPLEIPAGEVDARHGDLHRFGNPHYWLAPANAEPITRAILDGLTAVAPEHAETFAANRNRFLKNLDSALVHVTEMAAPLIGRRIVFYHNTWPYFAAFTGLVAAGFVEPYPGVPPSPTHLAELMASVRKQGITTIAVEPYFDRRIPNKIASETGARVVTLYPSIGGAEPDESYVEFLSGNIRRLLDAAP